MDGASRYAVRLRSSTFAAVPPTARESILYANFVAMCVHVGCLTRGHLLRLPSAIAKLDDRSGGSLGAREHNHDALPIFVSTSVIARSNHRSRLPRKGHMKP